MKKEVIIETLGDYKNYSPKIINTGGISTLGALGITLVILKSLGYLNISWMLALAPIWVPFALGIAVILGLLLFIVAVLVFNKNNYECEFVSTNSADVNIPKEETEKPKAKNKSHKKVKKESNGENTSN